MSGTSSKAVSFTVSLETFQRIAGAKTLEARVCNDEFALDPPSLAMLHAFAAKVRAGRPPAVDRKRFHDEQVLQAFADDWKPRDELAGQWRAITADDVVTFAAGANAQTFRVASRKCGQGLLAKMGGEDTAPIAAAGFRTIECVGGTRPETIDLVSRGAR